MLKALELEPTLPDWRLRRVVRRRIWIAYRSNGLHAVIAPGKEQDSRNGLKSSLTVMPAYTYGEKMFPETPSRSLS